MRVFITTLIFLGFSACHRVNHKQLSSHWSDINSWSITGKIAITDGRQSASGKFDWEISPENFTAQFKAPLGQGSWKISEDNNQAHLISSKHPDKFARNAQDLISNELGWSFPLEKLKFWIRGFEYLQTLNKHEKPIESISEEEWHVSYQKWQNTPLGLLPAKIKASKPPYSVKLIIYQWDFNKK